MNDKQFKDFQTIMNQAIKQAYDQNIIEDKENPDMIKIFWRLKRLDLSCLGLIKLDGLECFNKLEELSLHSNGIENTEFFNQWSPLRSSLKRLDISYNPLIYHFSGLENLKKLEYLDLTQTTGIIAESDLGFLKDMPNIKHIEIRDQVIFAGPFAPKQFVANYLPGREIEMTYVKRIHYFHLEEFEEILVRETINKKKERKNNMPIRLD